MTDLALSMRGITKSFSGTQVLKGVDFEVEKGEIHALVGANGAGKSTLLKILEGAYTPDSGVIEIAGTVVDQNAREQGGKSGVAMIFQEFSLVPTLSVAQNIFLGAEPRKRLGLINDREAERRTRELFRSLNLDVDPRRPLDALSTATWQLTEIAKAVSRNAGILVMDEPTSSLARTETIALFELMRRLRDQGVSVIFVSHRLDEVFEICDRITVLRDGRRMKVEHLSRMTMDSVIDEILGAKVEHALEWKPRTVPDDAEVLLDVRGLTAGPKVQDVSLQVRAGEIVGLAGLMGSGRSELVRAIFGVDQPSAGEVSVAGQKLPRFNPREAMQAGIGFVPEDRRTEGLVLDHAVQDNLILPFLKRISRMGFIDDAQARRETHSYVDRLSIKVRSINQPIWLLSGGNQQKVVIAKWLATAPRVLLLDEATAGVDIGTKAEIIEMIRAFADAGNAVIFISSELPELLAVSDRVLILQDGQVERDLARSEIADEEALQRAVQGVE